MQIPEFITFFETTRPTSQPISIYHGACADLVAIIQTNGDTIDASTLANYTAKALFEVLSDNDDEDQIVSDENGDIAVIESNSPAPKEYFEVPVEITGNKCIVKWTGELDSGANAIKIYLRLTKNDETGIVTYPATWTVRFQESPGFNPSVLEPIPEEIDFNLVRYVNAPWVTLDEYSLDLNNTLSNISDLSTDVLTLFDKNEDIVTDIGVLSTQIDVNSNNITTINGNIATITGNIDTVNSDIDALSTQIDVNSGDIDALSTGIIGINTNIAEVRQDVVNVQSDVQSLKSNKADLSAVLLSSELSNLIVRQEPDYMEFYEPRYFGTLPIHLEMNRNPDEQWASYDYIDIDPRSGITASSSANEMVGINYTGVSITEMDGSYSNFTGHRLEFNSSGAESATTFVIRADGIEKTVNDWMTGTYTTLSVAWPDGDGKLALKSDIPAISQTDIDAINNNITALGNDVDEINADIGNIDAVLTNIVNE